MSFIDGKWKILILSHLYFCENRSYSDFIDNLPGVSEKMLSQQLKELERDKLISKNHCISKALPRNIRAYRTRKNAISLVPFFE